MFKYLSSESPFHADNQSIAVRDEAFLMCESWCQSSEFYSGFLLYFPLHLPEL